MIIAVILISIEATSMSIITIWFAGGALLAMIASMLGFNFITQTIVFIFTSACLLYFTRPVVKKYFDVKKSKTNFDRFIGEYAEVTQDINKLKSTGEVKIQGQLWKAISNTDDEISCGERVKILQISGVKFIVEKTK
jgi:membrane protein implicated in regulation of membrane protease activity